jgi:TrmH family RNA methyltransferase
MSTLRTPQGLIAMIRRADTARGRQLTGCYAIEGIRLVERALRAGAPLEAVLVAERLMASAEPRHVDLLAALQAAGCPITIVPDGVVAELTEGRDLGPILGLVRLPSPVGLAALLAGATNVAKSGGAGEKGSRGEDEPMTEESSPPPPQARQLTPQAQPVPQAEPVPQEAAPPLPRSPAPPLFLAAADIVDPGNVGALTRTAHAAGAAALLAAGMSDPFHPRATRISRGSIFKLPVVRYETLAALLVDLRRHDVFIVGTTAAGGAPLPEVVWPARATAVLMGNEAEGLPLAAVAAVDLQVTIPMVAGVDSYSVNAAAAVLLYEAGRSRGAEGQIPVA